MYIKKIAFLFITFLTVFLCLVNVFAFKVVKTTLEYDGANHYYEAFEVNVMVNGNLIEEYNTIPIILDSRTLVPVRDIFERLGAEISWSDPERKVTITKDNDIIILFIDRNKAYRNSTAFELDVAPKIVNDYTMIPVRAVSEAFDCDVNWIESERVVSIYDRKQTTTTQTTTETTTQTTTETTTQTTTETTTKEEPTTETTTKRNNKKETTTETTTKRSNKKETTTETTTKRNNKKETTTETTTKRSSKKETTTETTTKRRTQTTTKEPTTETTTRRIISSEISDVWKDINEEKTGNGITLVWDQIGNANANINAMKRDRIKGLDVISPTWFEISNNSGDIYCKASTDYVKWAHSQGYKVWALFSNSFDSSITHRALSSSETRKKIINQISNYVDTYDLDGINIDFESVSKNDGEYYVQFIREITPVLRAKDVVVSVDMYIPSPWTAHYNMEEVGRIVDYVIIMAYDEHYSTSTESGSVSSKNWVDNAMKNACQKVDKNKLIMGVPFYTRRWAETVSNGKVNVKNVSMTMQEAYNTLISNNATITWNEDCGQYYGEYKSNGVTYKIWLEDERSMEERMKIAQKYGVAGIAGWKRGHEKAEVWDVINKYF